MNKTQTKKVTFKLNKKIDNLKINLPKLNIISNINNEIVISYDKKEIKIEEIIKLIKKDGLEIIDISTNEPKLEDVFIELTKI